MNHKIAYFSAEIGLKASLPTYSGGLGVLAGDHIKAALDIGLPIVAVTLLYKEGYFKQHIDKYGIQSETYPKFEMDNNFIKVSQKISLKLRGREVWIQPYKYTLKGTDGGEVPIYFLDTDIDENIDEDKMISLRLYSGNKNHRILQESVLGFGGIKLLDKLGCNSIHTYHMNEGHCSFLTLALLNKFNGNEKKVRSLCHFTTHTPVAAGHDQFSILRCREILSDYLPEHLKLPSWEKSKRLHMTELGIYFSRSANGVSKLHGEVAQNQFPFFNLDYITNGVYHPHWVGEEFKDLFNSKIKDWKKNPKGLEDLSQINDEDLDCAHVKQKNNLIDYANSKSDIKLSKNILTIGFARRSAEYKRAGLIFSNLNRLIDIGSDKIQIIFSGKAHPKDDSGKKIIEEIFVNADKLSANIKIVYLENYNMDLGKLITSGVDVWLNTPLRPNEASGTSGMKAALNGIPNLSIIDGWWAEAFNHQVNGWAIGDPLHCDDTQDSNSLYQILEDDIIPIFYNDKEKWIKLMRKSIQTGAYYSAFRMINQYNKKFYNNDNQINS